MSTAPTSSRQRLLDVASDLFYREGIRAISMDTIVERSGVSKATLYRHFPTKDELISAYLKAHDHHIWEHFDEAVAKHEGSPKDQLLALIDAIAELFQPEYYRGCPFLNAFAEFSDPHHPAHRLAMEYNHALRSRLSDLSRKAGVTDESWPDQLLLVINGAYSSVPVLGLTGSAAQLKKLTAQMIHQYVH
ncbi:TetR/AcrR family transcriptional regulator [Paenibacillus mucilaginosus]|uniref:Transcriptional regulator n=2 Tax=Paenibacillus mucilaginosus TaxID=61624 RepID=H6NJI6_9BACL|nr:TetR/AcrR family transcriptional regulator [Paenibacillus mucilaginosus]AEI41095.1 Transcriptional regulator [Paenibacillus mucilaginosus KNP414]AFC29666.1 transcriptional regulator [Paenibacillus mucilaginosus 3016]MCG7211467.1 TetR/AcrR family transcriptional regulator [Paenibacillus mucilaginosus]WDM30157.1 TetR/AcrR family transcriptional regulator [Paenibacillus mucilaginosus]WFA22581.1 TetR/AcrR family transcriptional regulator [Paenibacillus mucilaginosus]